MGRKETRVLMKYTLLVPVLLCLLASLGCVTASHVQLKMPPQRGTEIEFEVMKELEKFRLGLERMMKEMMKREEEKKKGTEAEEEEELKYIG